LNSMIQPILRVTGSSGTPVVGVTVDVFAIRNNVVQPDEWIRYTPVKTDSNGIATFTDVAFLDSCASSNYKLRFKACGVYNDSQTFKVHNDLSIEEERLDLFKGISHCIITGFDIVYHRIHLAWVCVYGS
jgi:5-hydroxyisourate hydrolase-like protein (transthyretin family)